MLNVLGTRSRSELLGVHADLIILVTFTSIRMPGGLDFTVFDGLRTPEEQKELIKQGASWTMDSRHLTGHAVDLVPIIRGKPSWDSVKAFKAIGAMMREGAEHYGIPIRWGANKKHGGDWARVNDMAHFELDRRHYPA